MKIMGYNRGMKKLFILGYLLAMVSSYTYTNDIVEDVYDEFEGSRTYSVLIGINVDDYGVGSKISLVTITPPNRGPTITYINVNTFHDNLTVKIKNIKYSLNYVPKESYWQDIFSNNGWDSVYYSYGWSQIGLGSYPIRDMCNANDVRIKVTFNDPKYDFIYTCTEDSFKRINIFLNYLYDVWGVIRK